MSNKKIIYYIDDDEDTIYTLGELEQKFSKKGYSVEFLGIINEKSKENFLENLYSKEKYGVILDYDLANSNIYGDAIELWETIKEKRLQATRTGVEVTLPNGQVRHFHTDQVARQEYDDMGLTIVLGTFEPRQWKTIENDWIEFDLDTFKALAQAIKGKVDHDYRNAEVLKAQIDKSDTPENINLNQGWSQSYV